MPTFQVVAPSKARFKSWPMTAKAGACDLMPVQQYGAKFIASPVFAAPTGETNVVKSAAPFVSVRPAPSKSRSLPGMRVVRVLRRK
jgi:hypothetical protein